MRILALSDTHQLHRELDRLPSADLLLHAGDWSFLSKSLASIRDFNQWIAEQPVKCGAVLVPGNHEFYLEADSSRRSLTSNATVLIGQRMTVAGLNIWGSSVTPMYGGAFGMSDASQRARHYAQIPLDTHILVTHGPPYGYLDGLAGTTEHLGCRELLAAVQRVKPRLHVFGHIHSGYGILETPHTIFVNAALLGPEGEIANKPILLDLQPLRRGGVKGRRDMTSKAELRSKDERL